MINKVELGSVNNKTPMNVGLKQKGTNKPSFTGLGDVFVNSIVNTIQTCEKYPMLNVTVLDLSTAILPRTFFETFIGSKKKDENGKETGERKLNLLGGFEALRREASGLIINCIIPSFIVKGVAKLLHRPVMGDFNKSNLVNSWSNSDSLSKVKKYYLEAEGVDKKQRIHNTLANLINDIEGVDGDINKGGLKKFKDIFAHDEEFEAILKEITENILSENPDSNFTQKLYSHMVKKSGIAENIRFANEKGFFSSNLSHLCESAGDILHGLVKEGDNIKNNDDVIRYFKKATNLVNAKSLAGLGLIIPLAISAQPINRWITHKISGQKGAPIYNDDKERILTPEEKIKLASQKCLAIPAMLGVAGLSMIMDRPSLKMFQFKGLFPTMDQARIISAATFSSRIAASEDSNELLENTIRDIATFSSFYFLGDYAAKGIATLLEHRNKDGIKLLNRLYTSTENTNVFKRLWNWAKHTKMKSSEELEAIANEALRTKAKNLRAWCQGGNIAFSLLSLGVFIPLYTRTQTNKKNQKLAEEKSKKIDISQLTANTTFTQNLIKNNSTAFSSFFK